MSCTFMQSTFNRNMNVHNDQSHSVHNILKLNVFYCQTILESFSLIDIFVYPSIEICVVVDYQNRLGDAVLLGENNII